jgi:hypothetical protein
MTTTGVTMNSTTGYAAMAAPTGQTFLGAHWATQAVISRPRG